MSIWGDYMKKRRKTNLLLVFLIALVLLMSVGYSFLVQDIKISATAYITPKAEYEEQQWGEEQITMQINNFVVPNNYNVQSRGWEVKFNVPSDINVTGAWNCLYTVDGTVLTVTNNNNNAVILPNGSTTFGLQFSTYDSTYVIDVLSIAVFSDENPNPEEEMNMSNNCLSFSQQGPWGGGNSYTSVFNVTITNNTDADIFYWEAHIGINDDNFKITNAWNCDYVITEDELILTGLAYNSSIAKNRSVTVGFNSTASKSNFALTDNYTIFKGNG